MSQSGAVALFLLAGFIVFITVRGELPQYLDVIGLAPKADSSAAATPASPVPNI